MLCEKLVQSRRLFPSRISYLFSRSLTEAGMCRSELASLRYCSNSFIAGPNPTVFVVIPVRSSDPIVLLAVANQRRKALS